MAFVFAAAATAISMIWQRDLFSDIILTKFVTFNITDGKHYIKPSMDGFTASGDKTRVTAFSLYTTKEEIHKLRHRWRCPSGNSTSDMWGPDNMCRCLGQYAVPKSNTVHPTTDDTLQAVEEMCSREVVPIYGKVFAGSIRGYWNFYIGILMIHVSILFSMKSVEYARAEYEKSQDPTLSAELVHAAEDNTGLLPSEIPAPIHTTSIVAPHSSGTHTTHVRNFGNTTQGKGHSYHQRGDWDRTLFNPEARSKLSLGTAFDWTRDVDTSENVYMQVGVPQTDTRGPLVEKLWDFLVVALSIGVVGFVSAVLNGQNDLVKLKVGGSAMVMYIWALVVAIVTASSIVMDQWELYGQPVLSFAKSVAQIQDKKSSTDTTGRDLRRYIKFCVLQDLNYITGFMLVISTFSAQSGEHDDHTIFLDVACVVFIGFMQHLSHLTMLLKEQALGLCEDQLKKQLDRAPEKAQDYTTDTIRSLKYEARMMDYIFQFFSTTRAFIFAIIGISVYVFSVRMGPTVFGNDAIRSWNGSARLFTLLFFVSPSILYDLYYELVHFDHMRRYQRHLQYFGPQIWRIWGGIAFIIVLCLMTMQGYGGDDKMYYEMDRFLGGIKPNAN